MQHFKFALCAEQVSEMHAELSRVQETLRTEHSTSFEHQVAANTQAITEVTALANAQQQQHLDDVWPILTHEPNNFLLKQQWSEFLL